MKIKKQIYLGRNGVPDKMSNNCCITINEIGSHSNRPLYEAVLKFGTPKKPIADNGSDLTSEVMNALIWTLQMSHTLKSVEHARIQRDAIICLMDMTQPKQTVSYGEIKSNEHWNDKYACLQKVIDGTVSNASVARIPTTYTQLIPDQWDFLAKEIPLTSSL